jgi:hypothetical protein
MEGTVAVIDGSTVRLKVAHIERMTVCQLVRNIVRSLAVSLAGLIAPWLAGA